MSRPETASDMLAAHGGWPRRCKLQPDAATTFPLERAGDALAALRDRRLNGRAVPSLRDD